MLGASTHVHNNILFRNASNLSRGCKIPVLQLLSPLSVETEATDLENQPRPGQKERVGLTTRDLLNLDLVIEVMAAGRVGKDQRHRFGDN